MFSKEELKKINTNFWEGFKLYMKGTKSSNGKRINWLNYPTEVKFIYLRLEADNKGARICFDIQHKHDEIRAIVYEQMTELKVVLEDAIECETIWMEDYSIFDNTISRIQWEIKDLSLYSKNDHVKIYNFLQKTLNEFDLFYQDYKDILVALTN
jgi:hypothetical protein